MSQAQPSTYGPPGRYRFPAAVNVAHSRQLDRLELALVLDDAGRTSRLAYRTWPSGKRQDAALREIAIPGGGSGRAAEFWVPANSLGVQLDFYDASGARLADLCCVLDARSGQLVEPPFTGEGYSLQGPLEAGPAGRFSRARALTLLSAEGHDLYITGKFLLDDGGDALFVEWRDPAGTRVERRLIPRATRSSPAAIELSFLAEQTRGFADFIDRKGQVLRELSVLFDFRAGALTQQTGEVVTALFRAGVLERGEVLSVLCRVCRNTKPLADCREMDLLTAEERELVEREALPTWDMPFVCSACLARVLESERERRKLSKLEAYWVTLGSSTVLFLQAFFGVMQLLLPHGPLLYLFLQDSVPFLATRHAALLAATSVLWGFLFTLLPVMGMARAYFQVFFVAPMGNGVLFMGSLGAQAFLTYWLVKYLQMAKVPEFLPIPQGSHPLLWVNFYLYAVVAALLNVLFNEFFGQSLSALADRLVRRGPGIAARVNRIFRRFQKLAGLHQDEEIYRTLREILVEDLGVREYHVLVSDETRGAFVPVASEGRALAEIANVRVQRGEANFLGHAAMFGEIYGTHSMRNPDLRRVLSRGPLPCEACVPVKVDGQVQALLNIARFDQGKYDSDDLAHLSTLSSLLGLALGNAREHRLKDERLAQSEAVLRRELTQKEELRSAFAKFVPPALIDRIMDDPDALEAEPERGTLTVLFTDLKGFSTLSEKVGDPAELARLLNLYLTAMTNIVFRHWGTLDKYVGDAVIAFFGWPLHYYEDHARRALLAAIEMRDRMADLAVEMGHPELSMRIGVNTGEMVVGNFGSSIRKSLTVLGDNVNLGARLEPTNKEYHTDILCTGETYAGAADAVWAREIDRVRVVGRQTPVVLYEPIAPRAVALPAELGELLDTYAEGLKAYQARDFVAAIAAFRRALDIVPEDGPSAVMLERATAYKHEPPPAGWDGVYSVKVK